MNDDGTYDIVEPVAEATPEFSTDYAATIDEGTTCLRCGYSLAGLRSDARCPECGSPAANSLAGPLLVASDPIYQKKLEQGANFVRISLILTVVAFLLGISVGISGLGITPLTDLIALGVGVFSLVGWWKLSEPDPAFRELNDPGGKSRQILRVALVVQFGFLVMKLGAGFFGGGLAPGVNFALGTMLTVLGMVVFVASFVQIFVGLMYIAKLADRVPDTRIVAEANSLRREYLIFIISFLTAFFLITVATIILPMFVCLLIFFGLGFIVWGIVLYTKMYSLLSGLRQLLIGVIHAASAIEEPGKVQ